MNTAAPVQLRNGFTTGTCAQGATRGAVTMLLTAKKIETVEVKTPSGQKLNLGLSDQEIRADFARCAVIKDSGDDPDITNGAKIIATVRFLKEPRIVIKGGKGVGRVTKPGLPVAIGEYAINPVPRKMIMQELLSYVSSQKKGFEVTISVVKGEELARQTFNPRLGIEGGISILGTTGIVEPKSQAAYKTSLSLELDVIKACGRNKVALVLGYVGEKFCRETLGLKKDTIVKIGDYVGFMLKQCAQKGFKEVILAGHLGKLAKVANGQFNTHYRYGDGRLDTIARYAKLSGASEEITQELLKQETAESAISILEKSGLSKTFSTLTQAVVEKINALVEGSLKISCYLLSLDGKLLSSYE